MSQKEALETETDSSTWNLPPLQKTTSFSPPLQICSVDRLGSPPPPLTK